MTSTGALSGWRWILIGLALCGSALYAFVLAPSYSDLHPIWTATRAVLQHSDPYSSALADQERSRLHSQITGDTPYDLRFAYPLPGTFFFVPVACISFEHARIAFTVLGFLLTILSVQWWTGRLEPQTALLVIAARPVMLGISTQQPTVLFAALLAAAFGCIRNKRPLAGGILLGLVTAKPQILLFIAAPVALWIVEDWKTRRTLLLGFAITSAMLFGTAFALQPGWFPEWIAATHTYAGYASDTVPMILLGHNLGLAVTLVLAAAGGVAFWRVRWQRDEALAVSIATVLVVTPFQPYNAIMLIAPACLLLGTASKSLTTVIARMALLEVWAFPVFGDIIELRFHSISFLPHEIDNALTQILACAFFAAFFERCLALYQRAGDDETEGAPLLNVPGSNPTLR